MSSCAHILQQRETPRWPRLFFLPVFPFSFNVREEGERHIDQRENRGPAASCTPHAGVQPAARACALREPTRPPGPRVRARRPGPPFLQDGFTVRPRHQRPITLPVNSSERFEHPPSLPHPTRPTGTPTTQHPPPLRRRGEGCEHQGRAARGGPRGGTGLPAPHSPPAPGQRPPGREAEETRAPPTRFPAPSRGRSRPGAAAQPTVPRHRRSPEGKRLTQLPAPRLALPHHVHLRRAGLELAPEPGGPRPREPLQPPPPAPAPAPARGSRHPPPRGPGLQLPSGPAAGPMAGAGACGARRGACAAV